MYAPCDYKVKDMLCWPVLQPRLDRMLFESKGNECRWSPCRFLIMRYILHVLHSHHNSATFSVGRPRSPEGPLPLPFCSTIDLRILSFSSVTRMASAISFSLIRSCRSLSSTACGSTTRFGRMASELSRWWPTRSSSHSHRSPSSFLQA